MSAIQLQQLVKRFGRFTALAGVDLTVATGQVFGFLGPNGAGKSTTIRILLDELRATSGSAHILGLDVRRDAVAIHRRLGYLPSDLALYPQLTGSQTLRFFGRLRGQLDWVFVQELADRFDANLHKKVGELSSGNRQKIGLIAALMHRPELVILDEPNTGLDPLVQHEFQQVLREIAQDGSTVFLSSHTLSEVQRVAQRVAIIRNGKIVAIEDVARLQSLRQVTVKVDDHADATFFSALPGAHDVFTDGCHVELNFDGELGALLNHTSTRYRIVDLSARDADLEEYFLTFYQDAA